MTRECEVEDCNRGHMARGYCTKHYARWQRHGDPELTLREQQPPLGDAYSIGGLHECWEWRGRLDRSGYGRHGWKLAHRVVWEEEVGPIPEGLTLDHLCVNPPCVNPSHLEPVTASENLRRRHARERVDDDHCKRGHLMTEENTYRYEGWFSCVECRRAASREYQQRKAQEKAEAYR